MRQTSRPARLAAAPHATSSARPRLTPRPISPLGPALLASAAGVVLAGVRGMRARSERRRRSAAAPAAPHRAAPHPAAPHRAETRTAETHTAVRPDAE